MIMNLIIFLSCIFILIISRAEFSNGGDTLTFSKLISSNDTLISADNRFQLGFFKPGNFTKYYLGIWLNIFPTKIVWIANRSTPLNDTSGVLNIGNDGNLVLLDSTRRIIWSTEFQNSSSRNIVAQLLDSGNLILRNNEDGSIRWQSFDHPSHVMLAGMKIGWDLTTGLNRNLTSWKSLDDPSPGEYTYGIDLLGLPQIFIWKNSLKMYRSGPWNGVYFGGITLGSSLPFETEVVINTEEAYYKHFNMRENSSLAITAITFNGQTQLLVRDNNAKDWSVLLSLPPDTCGEYGYCGNNSICTINGAQLCSCMIGYVPKYSYEWDARIWSNGCIRKNPLNCQERGEFVQLEGMKMPDFEQFRINISMSLEECKAECLKNCSCNAYASADTRESDKEHGCLLWFGELIDVRKLSIITNQKLYIRVPTSHIESKSDSTKKKNRRVIIIVTVISTSIIVLPIFLLSIWKRKSLVKGGRHGLQCPDNEILQLPFFDITTIAKATENFSDMRKIGEGGFGAVYKGKLSTEQEIAVKRLSENSSQGLDEFKTEVVLIAKLQHRNLVRLLGCCIHEEERILIYEYMPNGSLDSYIFGGSSKAKHSLLVWGRRFAIIIGIARGLLYLHRDSRLRIIHRDLKASNILLDNDMNPKISDFGTARTFGEEQLTTKTKRVVGTFGYMAPEYAIDGIYSMKSDVFSFGVLVIEIVSGKRNNQFQHVDHDYNLLGHAWKLWLEGRAADLIDRLMENSFTMSEELLRCIHVGLLCVQHRPEDRPSMSSVLLMFNSERSNLPQPKRPGFFTARGFFKSDSFSARRSSRNEMTNTMEEGR